MVIRVKIFLCSAPDMYVYRIRLVVFNAHNVNYTYAVTLPRLSTFHYRNLYISVPVYTLRVEHGVLLYASLILFSCCDLVLYVMP